MNVIIFYESQYIENSMKNNIMIFTINDLTFRSTKIKHINNGCVFTPLV